jgi:hypothetical protein
MVYSQISRFCFPILTQQTIFFSAFWGSVHYAGCSADTRDSKSRKLWIAQRLETNKSSTEWSTIPEFDWRTAKNHECQDSKHPNQDSHKQFKSITMEHYRYRSTCSAFMISFFVTNISVSKNVRHFQVLMHPSFSDALWQSDLKLHRHQTAI